jgi:hypothetical protein
MLPVSCCYLIRALFVNFENGGDMFRRNGGLLSKDYTALYHGRWNSLAEQISETHRKTKLRSAQISVLFIRTALCLVFVTFTEVPSPFGIKIIRILKVGTYGIPGCGAIMGTSTTD